MEEQIVFLDRFDEVASIRSKLEAVRGDHAAIVVPVGNRALHSPIAVRLVVRQAENLALKLGIVSSDATVRRLFREEGIPAFRTVKAYRDYVARQSAPLTRLSSVAQVVRTRIDRTAGVIILILLLGLGGLMAYALLPIAIVEVAPVTESVGDAIVIKADPTVKALNVETKQIPARAINIPLESSIQVPTTGRKLMPNARAEGQVTLTNRAAGPVRVPEGTIVRTSDNVRFVITQEVTVPAGSVSATRVDVTAIDPGERGNVDRGKINKIEGPLDQRLAVFNEEPITGGGAREVPIVLAEDKEKAKAALVERMQKEAISKLEAQRRESESLPPHSVSFTVLEEVYDKKEGDQAKVLNLKIVGRASGLIFDGRDVNELIKRVWQPRTRSGYTVPPNTYKVYPPEIVKVDAGVVTFVVRVEGVAVAQINESRIQENVRWKTASEAKLYLVQTLSLAKEPKVTIEPGWASRALRVKVLIAGDWVQTRQE